MGPTFLPAPQTPAWPARPRSGPGRAGGLILGSPRLQPHLTLEMGLDASHSEVSPPYFLLAKPEALFLLACLPSWPSRLSFLGQIPR